MKALSTTRKIGTALTLLLLSLGISSCGGGGGGDSFIGAAVVHIKASPTRIDTGDRSLIEIELRDINENGIALKIRIPSELSYVADSGTVEVGNDEDEKNPDVQANANSNFKYLVFYLSYESFEEGGEGTLSFFLEGNAKLTDGEVEVDPDVDDPLIDNADEFDVDNPEFSAEDRVGIEVVG